MASVTNMIFLAVALFAALNSATGRLQGDVQTEIRIMKEQIQSNKDSIKEDEELTKVSMATFSQLIKTVNTRVSDAVKDMQDLSKREEYDHEQVTQTIKKVESLECQSTAIIEQLQELTEKEKKEHRIVSENKDKIQSLEHQSHEMKQVTDRKIQSLEHKSEETKNATDQKIQSLEHQSHEMKQVTDRKIQSLEHKSEETKNATDQKIQSLEHQSHEMKQVTDQKIQSLEHKSEETKNATDQKFQEMKQITNQKIQSLEHKSEEMKEEMKEETNSLKLDIKSLQQQMTRIMEKGIIDKLHPIGSIYMTFSNIQPPMNGVNGIQWELLPEGYALITANQGNTGTQSGQSRLDNGNTQGHTLSISEMPSHSHSYTHYYDEHSYGRDGGSRSIPYHTYSAYSTASAGGDQPHSHNIKILNMKVMVWKRSS